MCNGARVAHSSCPRTPPGRENVGTTPLTPPGPRMNVQHDPTPPAGTTTSHRRPPPTPTRPTRQLNPEANTLRPDPYRTTQPADTPTRRPTLIAHLRPHPHKQAPCPDHATGGRLVRPGQRRPSRQRGPAGRLGEHFVHKVTDCAENDLDSLPSAQNVTLCTKCPAPHKTSPPHHPHPHDQDPRPPQTGPAPSALRGLERCGVLPDTVMFTVFIIFMFVLMHLAVRGAPCPKSDENLHETLVRLNAPSGAGCSLPPASGSRVVATFPGAGSPPALRGPSGGGRNGPISTTFRWYDATRHRRPRERIRRRLWTRPCGKVAVERGVPHHSSGDQDHRLDRPQPRRHRTTPPHQIPRYRPPSSSAGAVP